MLGGFVFCNYKVYARGLAAELNEVLTLAKNKFCQRSLEVLKIPTEEV